tara:strand:+ start:187 stop:564 length:378 start_codon:yes stop_codon:yes gene_type:complete
MSREKKNDPRYAGNGGKRKGAGRPKGSRNLKPSKSLILAALCSNYGTKDVQEAKEALLKDYLKTNDKGMQYFVEILFGKAVDQVKLEADVKVTTVKGTQDLDELFDEMDDEDEDYEGDEDYEDEE